MNDQEPTAARAQSDEDTAKRGPNLALIYSLIVLALLVAIAVAGMIVLPFYHRH